jgi:isopentenyl diphosphate isomerase/L-lactate dehydrogenase-like FMN-dependent dehydrogenase
MSPLLSAAGFPEEEVRRRATAGAAAAMPDREGYGRSLHGAQPTTADLLDTWRLVPPAFTPRRHDKLIDLGREPLHHDVDLDTMIGGLSSPAPLIISALGSTRLVHAGLGGALARQAGGAGIPMVIGENVVPSSGFGRHGGEQERSMLSRIAAYCSHLPDRYGGVAVQQSTEDADSEVWNTLYSDPSVRPLLDSGRLAFELKVGQGAKPGLGGMAVVPVSDATSRGDQFHTESVYGPGVTETLRFATPGTFTEEILRRQVMLMRSNFPKARVWVKLPPTRDVAYAARTAWAAGAECVTVDGAEGGTGWAPRSVMDHVGLPLAECLLRIDPGPHCLVASGRMWEGARAVKSLALGARAVGLGRAALLAVDQDPDAGLLRLLQALSFEMRLLISALGKYAAADVDGEDLWPCPASTAPVSSPRRFTGRDAIHHVAVLEAGR